MFIAKGYVVTLKNSIGAPYTLLTTQHFKNKKELKTWVNKRLKGYGEKPEAVKSIKPL